MINDENHSDFFIIFEKFKRMMNFILKNGSINVQGLHEERYF